MGAADTRVAREAKAMTRREIVVQAFAGVITWAVAATILGMTERHVRRIKARYEQYGVDGLQDQRGGRPRARRVSVETIQEVCRLKREVYADFSMKHFHEKATEKHGLKLSYTLMRSVLQDAGLVEKAPGRGKYRRKRERRPMPGMMLHMDGSTHEWLSGLPKQDLIVVMDDADGRILYARFFEQEGTHSTLAALHAVVRQHGRFAELYTDRGSHFGRTPVAGGKTLTDGQVSRACRTLGIRQILARSPEARGRSERAFQTIQGRLPQELRVEGVVSYEQANLYLERTFVPDFNRLFTVKPAQPGTAFVAMAGIDLDLVLSTQHERVVEKDNTVAYERMKLQLAPSDTRAHFVRCPVMVHELVDRTLAVTHHGKVVGRYTADGQPLVNMRAKKRRRAA
jgi:transposase